MRYRIRYEQSSRHHDAEVEAHSPTEAVVKFENLSRGFSNPARGRPRVTSVAPVDSGENSGWAEEF